MKDYRIVYIMCGRGKVRGRNICAHNAAEAQAVADVIERRLGHIVLTVTELSVARY